MANLLSTTVNGALNSTGRITASYDADRYQMNFNRASASNWWVTNDAGNLGFHLNNVGDRFYFGTGGDFWSSANGWLSTALAGKLSTGGTAANSSQLEGFSAYALVTEARGAHSGSDFPNGTLVTTDINANVWAGDSFIMEVSGKSYGSGTPFKLIMEGYLYADTIINVSAMSYGSYFPAPVKVMRYNGNIAFWWPRGSYWNSFEVHVRSANGDSWNRVTGITDSVDPASADKKISITPTQVIHTGNIGSQSVSYATTAGSITGQANSATINASTGVNANDIVRRDGNGYIYANHINFNTPESENPTISSFITSNGDGWSRKSSLAHVRNQLGNYGSWITTDGRAYPRRSDGTNINFYWDGQGGQPTWLWGSNNGVDFYVWNPSNFSVDLTQFQAIPDNRGNAYQPNDYAGQRVWWHFNNKDAVGGYGTYWHAIQTVSPWTSYDSSHRQQQIQWGGTDISFRYATSGTTWSSWFRFITDANIASQSVSYAVTSGTSSATTQTNFAELFIEDVAVATKEFVTSQGYLTSLPSHNHDDRYYTESESDGKYLIGTTNPGSVANFTISIGNNGSYSYVQSHSGQPLYLNPVGNSIVLNSTTTVAGTAQFNSNTTWFSGRATIGLENQSEFARFAFYGLSLWDWDHGEQMVVDGNYVYVNNYLQAGNSLRAPIFYDSADTAYYLDPSNTLKSLNVAGNIDLIARSAAWAEGIRVRVPSTSTWGGIRFTRDRGNDDGNWAIGFTGIDSTDDLTFWGNTAGNGAMRMRLDHSSNLIAYGSMRAPIFYDSNDTYYYVDPNSMSRISSARIVGGELRFHNSSYYSDLNYWGARFYSQDDGNGVPLYVQVQWVDGWRTALKIASGIDDNNPSLRTYGRTQLATDGGFVGVATTSPVAELDVNGRLVVRGGNRLYWGVTTTLGSWTTAQYASGSTHLFNAQRFDFTNEGYGSTTFAIINSEGVYTNNSILFPQTQFSPSAGSRTLTPPMSIRMFDNYFSGIGLGSDYGTVLEYYSRISHVDTQVYFDAAGGSWYRTASYAAGYSAWNQYITSGNIGSQNVNASNYQYATGSSSDAIASFRQTPAHATSFREISSSGPGGTWWMIQNFRHSNASNYWGTQVAWGWEDNALRLMQRNVSADSWSGWVEYLNTNNAAYAWNMNQYVRTSDAVTFASTTTQTFLIASHSDNTKGYRIHNTSGSSVSAMFTNSANALVIGAGAFDQVQLNKKVLVSGAALGVNVAASATAGRIDASNDIVAYSSSDERLKYNIAPIENALDKVKSLTGVEFDWKPEYKHAHGYEGHDTGIIAQQVEAVMPSAVRTNDTGFLAVRYEKLIGLLIEANKELAARVEELEKKLG